MKKSSPLSGELISSFLGSGITGTSVLMSLTVLFQDTPPRTYAGDNDPLDVLVICQEEIAPMTLVETYPIGVLIMTDDNEQDEKIIAICKKDPFLNCYKDISELPQNLLSEIKHFFEVYKQLEGKQTTVDKMLGRDEAEKIIQKSIEDYINNFEK